MVYREIQAFDFEALSRLEKKLQTKPQSKAGLEFFSRSPHSFLAHFAGEIHGFVLAQAVWQGDQTLVLVSHLLADSEEAYRGLVGKVVQSAYNLGASGVAIHADARQAAVMEALKEHAFSFAPQVLAVRELGRGEKGESQGVLE